MNYGGASDSRRNQFLVVVMEALAEVVPHVDGVDENTVLVGESAVVDSVAFVTLLMPTWTWPSFGRGFGLLNLDARRGPGYHLLRMNARLVESLSRIRNAFVLDAGRWVAE